MSKKFSIDVGAEMIGEIQRNIRTPLSLEEASQRAAAGLTSDYRELVSVLPDDWATRLFAWLRLHAPRGENTIRDPNIFLLQGWMESGLLALLDTGVLKSIVTTPESNLDVQTLRKSVKFHDLMPKPEASEETSATATEPTGPTEADLDAVVIADWTRLCSADIRSKCLNDADYRARFDRLMTAGRLGR